MKIIELNLNSKLKLNALELKFLLLSFSIVIISLFFYFNHIPLKLMTQDFVEKKAEIGSLSQSAGSVKSESIGDLGFRAIKNNDLLFNKDIIVTSRDSKATLSLTESGVVELGPQTMVSLSLVSMGSLTGIHHMPKLTVVTGQIKAKPGQNPFSISNGAQELMIPSKSSSLKSTPEEGLKVLGHSEEEFIMSAAPATPTRLSSKRDLASTPDDLETYPPVELGVVYTSRTLSPAPGSHFNLISQEGRVIKDILFRWTTEKESELSELIAWRVSKNPSETDLSRQLTDRNIVLREKIQSHHHDATLTWKVPTAGYFVWKILGPQSKDSLTSTADLNDFTVEPEYPGIEHRNVMLRGKEEGYLLTLEWKSQEKVDYFEILFFEAQDSPSPQLAQTSKQNSITLDETMKLPGVFYYKIHGIQKTGFILTSPLKKVEIGAFPPTLTLPESQAEITLNSRDQKETGVVLTWIKDFRFKEYSVEISTDPSFVKNSKQAIVSDNYYRFKNPQPGKYWWRVRGLNQKLKSTVSDGRAFMIKS